MIHAGCKSRVIEELDAVAPCVERNRNRNRSAGSIPGCAGDSERYRCPAVNADRERPRAADDVVYRQNVIAGSQSVDVVDNQIVVRAVTDEPRHLPARATAALAGRHSSEERVACCLSLVAGESLRGAHHQIHARRG